MLNDLVAVAEGCGYRVVWHKGGPKGAWIPDRQVISLRNGLDDVQVVCVLAHELGHAYYRDPAGCDPRRERRADRFAARLLISPVEYSLAESLYEGQAVLIAAELGVTTHLVQVWRTLVERDLVPAH